MLFYHSVTQAGIGCYAANAEFVAHPEWHLKTDAGVPTPPPRIDVTVPAARAWWLGVPFNATAGWVPGLIDGILADDSGFNVVTGVSPARAQAQYDGKHSLLAAMQAKMQQEQSMLNMAEAAGKAGSVKQDSALGALMNQATGV